MAQAYGSKDHPVNLGPFRRIVGVHWRNDTHIAILWGVRAATTFLDDTVACSPPEYGGPFEPYPPPPHPVAYTYLTGVDYSLPSSSFGQGILDIQVRKTSGWHGLEEDATVTGLPTLPPPASNGPWEYLWTPTAGTVFHYNTDGVSGHADNDLAATFAAASGTNTDIPLPSGHPGFFQTGFTPSFGLKTRAYLSASEVCYTFAGITSTVRFYSETDSWADTFPVPLNDIVATYKGKTYRGMAARQIETVIAGVPLERNIWILCEREKTP